MRKTRNTESSMIEIREKIFHCFVQRCKDNRIGREIQRQENEKS